jgi:hypothetical protein
MVFNGCHSALFSFYGGDDGKGRKKRPAQSLVKDLTLPPVMEIIGSWH